jgi:peroxidase
MDYLPVLIGLVLGPCGGYDPRINAQVTQEFSTAAFSVGHSEVSETQGELDQRRNATLTRLSRPTCRANWECRDAEYLHS